MKKNTEVKKYKNSFLNWIEYRLPIISYLEREYGDYPMPKNANYFWSFGAMLTIILVVMIFSGIFLAMYYTPHVDMAFESTERIMRDVSFGWLIRYIHSNGASFFFIVVYLHMVRSIYYGSFKYPRELNWLFGVTIYLLMMVTAFLGYTLPWGQMSYWAATVITNLFSAIPLVGESIKIWLLGDYTVGNATLNRFFALHYVLPFVILGIVALHVAAVHVHGSNNPSGVEVKTPKDTVKFFPYMLIKDTLAFSVFGIIISAVIFFGPNLMAEVDNYIPADPMVTPAHIVPNWYLAPFYAILRAVPDKLGGVVLMFGSILVLFFLPWLDKSKIKSCSYRPVYKWMTILFFADFFILGYVGLKPAVGTYLLMARVGVIYYFLYFLVLAPLVPKFEKTSQLPDSISDVYGAK
ncbi:MAG: cytochrome b [Alphaproteobacteria bacterium MarineAlpha5_Bin11]|nr:cytochrome b [Pelagibacteraceae bacterium]PPR43951.1 MAG: cytochrome b [Alphaproteobacteria bacterium MarineAlpha5_Bin11]PPR50476.1 MAG: cytochrome b [Alphaproteobacteria bacterium MarineAlpha5_Bin10]|tara:strand:- start:10718 stop:11941 length:1224 start_codon:yes stop_codon:yes gene_type:complete